MHLKQIEVRGLNGALSYSIPCHETGITLLTGPNGYGKTSILRLVDAVFNLRLDVFAQLNFDSVEISMADSSGLKVEKAVEGAGNFVLTFSVRTSRRKRYVSSEMNYAIDDFEAEVDSVSHFTASIDKFIRSKERRGLWRRLPGTRWKRNTGETLTLEDVQILFLKSAEAREQIPDAFADFVGSVDPLFLSAQRLNKADDSSAVNDIALKIRKQIEDAQGEYSKASQRIDQDFPRKLLSRSSLKPCTEDEVRLTYDRLADLWKRYRELNLLQEPGFEGFGRRIYKNRLPIAMMYLEEQRRKLEVFSEIEKRMMLFIALVNEHLELGKSARFSDAEGIEIKDAGKRSIPLTRLSSGEQHLLVLFGRLLFHEQAPTLVLMDEPELSLHPSWQLSFVESIERIREIVNVDFLLATHSPTVVENRLDQMVDLWKVKF